MHYNILFHSISISVTVDHSGSVLHCLIASKNEMLY
jgi:hypothetical protein